MTGPPDCRAAFQPQAFFGSSRAKGSLSLAEALRGVALCDLPEETHPMLCHSDLRTTFFCPRTSSLDVAEAHFLLLEDIDLFICLLVRCLHTSNLNAPEDYFHSLFLFCRQNTPRSLNLSWWELFFIPSVTLDALLLPKEDVGGSGLIPAGARGIFLHMWVVRVTPGNLTLGTARTLGTRRVWWEARRRRDTAEYNPQKISHKRF